MSSSVGTLVVPALAAPAGRLRSLDAFRGLVIALMFFVNLSANDAAFPAWFEHAGWNGGRHGQWLADFVFPWFLFIVGVAIPFSMTAGRGRAQPPWQRMLGAVRRGLLIYALGMVVWMAKISTQDSLYERFGPLNLSCLLHWDILPLIALGYVLAVWLYHTPRWLQIGFVLAVLVAKAVTMPDLSATVGLDASAWMQARTDLEYQTRTLGFAGTAIAQGLPATAVVVLGMLAGGLLQRSRKAAVSVAMVPGSGPRPHTRELLGGGVLLVVLALVLHWVIGHRISKDFLTSSYVLLSAGSGAMLLWLLHGALDVWAWPRWRVSLLGVFTCGVMIALVWLLGGMTQMTVEQRRVFVVCAIALGTLAGVMLFLAAANVVIWPRAEGQCSFLVIYGSNALAIYIASELLWTMVWMNWRVQAPAGYGAQQAFSALRLWWVQAIKPFAGDLAPGLGGWLASGTLIGVYFAVALWLWRRKLFIRV